MANQGDVICKYNSTKVNTGIKKKNKVIISSWGKSGINGKNIMAEK